MTFDARLIVVALAIFAVANAAISLAVGWGWRPQPAGASPAVRASTLFHWRLAPSMLALVATIIAMAAFMRYEPRQKGEETGLLLLALSLGSAALAASALRRLIAAQIRTTRILREWKRTATPVTLAGMSMPCFAIDVAFPAVAVAGVIRPRLFIARTVLDSCPPDELCAILRHERHHVARHDNARHLVFVAAPDFLAWSPLARLFGGRWHDAAEEMADDAAAPDETRRLHLAAALVRVARLVPRGHGGVELPASAFYRGEALEGRIRRLLDRPAVAAPGIWRSWHIALALTCIVIGLSSLGAIQALVEAAVKFLP
jgi:Zn-dependent protease with chaperone function